MAKRPSKQPKAEKFGPSMLDNPAITPEQKKAAAEERKIYSHWMEEIKAAERQNRDYVKRGREILKLYKDERKTSSEIARASDRMNILWSNVETLKPALYSKMPMPNVSRRFTDGDPVARTASLMLERCLVTVMDLCDFDYAMQRAVLDYLLPGRGTVWVRYAPLMGMAPMKEPVTAIPLKGANRTIYRPMRGGDEIDAKLVKKGEDGVDYYETEEEQVLSYGIDLDHLVWSDFLHEQVNDWSKVTWCAKRVSMKRPKLIKQFGEEIGKAVQLNKSFNAPPKGDDGAGYEMGGTDRGKPDACDVYEIWSKDHGCVYWISDGLPDRLLKKEEDPLGLSDFWPLPRPLFATTTTDSQIPVPDYALYQDQAEQLDRLTDRIRLLIGALRVVGVYNAELASLDQLLGEAGENEMVPVQNWMAFANTGGLKGNLDWLPIEQISGVLAQLFQARAQIKQDLYEVTGISDVVRGSTNAQETATAQQIKANFGNLRLQARQAEVARFARDTVRKMAEIIAEQYPEEAIIEMSGVMQLDEFKPSGDPQKDAQNAQKIRDAIAMLKSDKLRTFKIDIETDATVAPDQDKEKQSRVEFLTAVAPFLEKAAQVGASSPQFIPLLLKMLDFGVKGFRVGRTLENAIDETIQTVEKMQAEAQAQGPQQPADPAAEAMAQKLQAETQKLQEELAQLQAQGQVKAQENEARRIEIAERTRIQKEQADKQALKLSEEIFFRRVENEKRIAELEASVELKRLQIRQLQDKEAMAEITGMIPADQAPTNPNQELMIEAERADLQAKLASSQFELEKAQAALKELQSRRDVLAMAGQASMPEHLGGGSFANTSIDEILGLKKGPGAGPQSWQVPPSNPGGAGASA